MFWIDVYHTKRRRHCIKTAFFCYISMAGWQVKRHCLVFWNIQLERQTLLIFVGGLIWYMPFIEQCKQKKSKKTVHMNICSLIYMFRPRTYAFQIVCSPIKGGILLCYILLKPFFHCWISSQPLILSYRSELGWYI